MWFCLCLIACFAGRCAVARPALDQGVTWPDQADDRNDDLGTFLNETAEIDRKGLNTLPGDPEA
jgi:hypothetical protein